MQQCKNNKKYHLVNVSLLMIILFSMNGTNYKSVGGGDGRSCDVMDVTSCSKICKQRTRIKRTYDVRSVFY